jgi:chaperonin GroES
MAVKPLEDRVLVKPVEKASVTSSGLYLPESSKEKPIHGTVVAVGPGKRLENGNRATMSVHTGDIVVYASYAGTEVEVNGESHLVMRESELLGIMN